MRPTFTLVLLVGLFLAGAAQDQGRAQAGGPSNDLVGAGLDDTYWYVPTTYLPASLTINSVPRVVTVSDQTVWRIVKYSGGYVSGISATNLGAGWSYTLMNGSITPDGSVKLSFSPLGSPNPNDPTTQVVTTGDGTLRRTGMRLEFLMQMATGTAAAGVTHWARMMRVGPGDREWLFLPGYPTTGVPDLELLQTPIVYR